MRRLNHAGFSGALRARLRLPSATDSLTTGLGSGRGCRGSMRENLFLKQRGMGPRTHEDDDISVQPVDQQEVAAEPMARVPRDPC